MIKVYVEKDVLSHSKIWKKLEKKKIETEKEYEFIVCDDFSSLVIIINPMEENIVYLSDELNFEKTKEKARIIKSKFSDVVLNIVGKKKRKFSELNRFGLNEFVRKKSKNKILNVFNASLKLAQTFANDDYVHVDKNQIEIEKKGVNIVTVTSGSGGVGKTSVAVNLAASYAEFGLKVCLVDYSLQYGDIGLYTNVKPEFTVYDLVVGNLDDNPNLNLFIKHLNPNLFVLPAPTLPEQADYITRRMSVTLTKILAKNFDVVIFDTSNFVNDLNLELFKLSQQILFVTTKDLSSIKNTKLAMDFFEKLGISKKVGLVLNNYDHPKYEKIENEVIKKLVGKNIIGTIPFSEKIFNNSINSGDPLLYSYSEAKVADSFRSLMSKVRYNCVVGEYESGK